MKKKLSLLMALALSFSLTACGGGAEEAPAEGEADPQVEGEAPATGGDVEGSGAKIEMSFCVVSDPGNPQNQAYREMAESLATRSGGNIEVNLFEAASMGGIAELAQGVIDGSFQFVVLSTNAINSFDPGLLAFDLPYLWPSAEVATSVLNNSENGILAAHTSQLTESGATMLAVANNGFAIIGNDKLAVRTPADAEGLKLRVPESPTMQGFMDAIGVAPTIMAVPEVYTSIQTGVLDGCDYDLNIAGGGRYDEVMQYFTMTDHILKLNGYVVNTAWWDGLDEADRTIIEEEIMKMAETADKYMDEGIAGFIDIMTADGAEIIELTEDEKAVFVEIGTGIWGEFEDIIDMDAVAKIQAEIEAYEG